MPNRSIPGCKFDSTCARPSLDGASAAIRQNPPSCCPFPSPLVDRSWSKGAHLFHQGDRVKGAFSLRHGLVALERVNENGENVVLKLLQPGAFFPCADLFSDGLHGNSARALVESAACFIPAERLGAALASNPRMGLDIAKLGCEEARANEDIIVRLCSADLAERVLAVIESLAREATEPDPDGRIVFHMPIAWRDLAAMVGTSPEVMSRLLRKLGDCGRLRVSGRRITLPAEDGGRRAFG